MILKYVLYFVFSDVALWCNFGFLVHGSYILVNLESRTSIDA